MAKYKHYSYDKGVMTAVNFKSQIAKVSTEPTLNWLVEKIYLGF